MLCFGCASPAALTVDGSSTQGSASNGSSGTFPSNVKIVSIGARAAAVDLDSFPGAPESGRKGTIIDADLSLGCGKGAGIVRQVLAAQLLGASDVELRLPDSVRAPGSRDIRSGHSDEISRASAALGTALAKLKKGKAEIIDGLLLNESCSKFVAELVDCIESGPPDDHDLQDAAAVSDVDAEVAGTPTAGVNGAGASPSAQSSLSMLAQLVRSGHGTKFYHFVADESVRSASEIFKRTMAVGFDPAVDQGVACTSSLQQIPGLLARVLSLVHAGHRNAPEVASEIPSGSPVGAPSSAGAAGGEAEGDAGAAGADLTPLQSALIDLETAVLTLQDGTAAFSNAVSTAESAISSARRALALLQYTLQTNTSASATTANSTAAAAALPAASDCVYDFTTAVISKVQVLLEKASETASEMRESSEELLNISDNVNSYRPALEVACTLRDTAASVAAQLTSSYAVEREELPALLLSFATLQSRLHAACADLTTWFNHVPRIIELLGVACDSVSDFAHDALTAPNAEGHADTGSSSSAINELRAPLMKRLAAFTLADQHLAVELGNANEQLATLLEHVIHVATHLPHSGGHRGGVCVAGLLSAVLAADDAESMPSNDVGSGTAAWGRPYESARDRNSVKIQLRRSATLAAQHPVDAIADALTQHHSKQSPTSSAASRISPAARLFCGCAACSSVQRDITWQMLPEMAIIPPGQGRDPRQLLLLTISEACGIRAPQPTTTTRPAPSSSSMSMSGRWPTSPNRSERGRPGMPKPGQQQPQSPPPAAAHQPSSDGGAIILSSARVLADLSFQLGLQRRLALSPLVLEHLADVQIHDDESPPPPIAGLIAAGLLISGIEVHAIARTAAEQRETAPWIHKAAPETAPRRIDSSAGSRGDRVPAAASQQRHSSLSRQRSLSKRGLGSMRSLRSMRSMRSMRGNLVPSTPSAANRTQQVEGSPTSPSGASRSSSPLSGASSPHQQGNSLAAVLGADVPVTDVIAAFGTDVILSLLHNSDPQSRYPIAEAAETLRRVHWISSAEKAKFEMDAKERHARGLKPEYPASDAAQLAGAINSTATGAGSKRLPKFVDVQVRITKEKASIEREFALVPGERKIAKRAIARLAQRCDEAWNSKRFTTACGIIDGVAAASIAFIQPELGPLAFLLRSAAATETAAYSLVLSILQQAGAMIGIADISTLPSIKDFSVMVVESDLGAGDDSAAQSATATPVDGSVGRNTAKRGALHSSSSAPTMLRDETAQGLALDDGDVVVIFEAEPLPEVPGAAHPLPRGATAAHMAIAAAAPFPSQYSMSELPGYDITSTRYDKIMASQGMKGLFSPKAKQQSGGTAGNRSGELNDSNLVTGGGNLFSPAKPRGMHEPSNSGKPVVSLPLDPLRLHAPMTDTSYVQDPHPDGHGHQQHYDDANISLNAIELSLYPDDGINNGRTMYGQNAGNDSTVGYHQGGGRSRGSSAASSGWTQPRPGTAPASGYGSDYSYTTGTRELTEHTFFERSDIRRLPGANIALHAASEERIRALQSRISAAEMTASKRGIRSPLNSRTRQAAGNSTFDAPAADSASFGRGRAAPQPPLLPQGGRNLKPGGAAASLSFNRAQLPVIGEVTGEDVGVITGPSMAETGDSRHGATPRGDYRRGGPAPVTAAAETMDSRKAAARAMVLASRHAAAQRAVARS